MGIFEPRVAFKPFEYPEATRFKDAINHSYWLVTEWNFSSDVQDFKTRLTDHEQQIIRDTLLAISQVEVAVKRFWTRLGERFPKPEFEQVAVTFGESEVRHADAYSHLLQVLGLNEDFAQLEGIPCMQKRMELLASMSAASAESGHRHYLLLVALFSSFTENVSLFSQFAIIKSFNKHRSLLKDIDNVVQATQKEETVHAMFGQWLINQVRSEQPSWFDSDFEKMIIEKAWEAWKIEEEIINWIFRSGDLEFLPRSTLQEFVLDRLNQSLEAIGIPHLRKVDPLKLEPLRWFNEELHADVHSDFFHKRPTTYAKHTKSIKEGDLF